VVTWGTVHKGHQSTTQTPTPVTLSNRVQIDYQGSLHFASVQESDQTHNDIYACTVSNPLLNESRTGSYSTLTVKKSKTTKNIKPTAGFIYNTPSRAGLGQTIQLHCFFNGYPTPTIKWSRPVRPLPLGRHFLTGNTLTVQDATVDDMGEYICEGSNVAGTARQYTQLFVDAPPAFVSPLRQPYNRNVTQGRNVTYICDAVSQPMPSITWYVNGLEITDNSTLTSQVIVSPDRHQVTLVNVCKYCDVTQTGARASDLGVIACNASNQYGHTFAEGYLNVLDRTLITVPPASQKVSPGSVVSLTCQAQSDPSTPLTYYWLHDDFIIPLTDHYRVVYYQYAANELSITVPLTHYEPVMGTYTCLVTNGYSFDMRRANITSVVSPTLTTTADSASLSSSSDISISTTPSTTT
jgi:hypothetical protein